MSFPMTINAYREMTAHVCTDYTNMQLSIDGLVKAVQQSFNIEPTSGHLFLFMNEKRNRIKLLIYHNGGYWLLYKRLEKGRFPEPALLAKAGMSIKELMWTLDHSSHKMVRRTQDGEVLEAVR